MDVALVPDASPYASPTKLFEYMGCGMPILAPSLPAIERALHDGSEGALFEPRNVESMAEALRRLASDDSARAAMGRAARARAEKDHSWEGIARRIVDLFEKQKSGQEPGADST